ncbi:pyrimidine utilization protein D [Desertibaculum subflavum]|uniref:pyrimidine utilization protein D n=1 Tax=Desertibaculum subflavum TaxID=2268458 RepID=UPI0034D257CC
MTLHFERHGRTDAVETVLLSAGLGGAGGFWAPQIEALGRRFQVITYDQRGTGRSKADLPENYSIDAMAEDVLDVMRAAGVARVHLVGHALGGLIGLALALRRPGAIGKLVLINAWAAPDPHTARCFAARRRLLQNSGIAAYVEAQPIFLYPSWWLSAHAAQVEAEVAHGIAHFQGTDTLLKRIDALLAFDIAARLGAIAAPALVVASKDDALVPYTCSERLAAGLPRCRFELFEHGGHGITVTAAAASNAAMLRFLADQG